MEKLDSYHWSGHAVEMGNGELRGQKAGEVLTYFGKRVKAARCHCRKFAMDGISQGKRNELVGGGLLRGL